jgi:hypothetical protein
MSILAQLILEELGDKNFSTTVFESQGRLLIIQYAGDKTGRIRQSFRIGIAKDFKLIRMIFLWRKLI